MIENSLRLLRFVVETYHGKLALEERSQAALDLAVEGAEWPPTVDVALNLFLEEASVETLRRLQHAVVTSMRWEIGVQSFIELAAGLVADEYLELSAMAEALAAIPYASRTGLGREEQRLVEAADAVVEDQSDAVMDISEDDLFSNALQAYWKLRVSQ